MKGDNFKKQKLSQSNIELDKSDNNIIELLKKNYVMSLTNLWCMSFCREAMPTFLKRLDRLKELNVISIASFPYGKRKRYEISLF